MNTKSEISEADARLRGELKERGNMNCETMNRRIDDRSDALEQIERDEYETARPLFGHSSICNRVCTVGSNDRDSLVIKNAFEFWSRSTENVALHIETRADGITVDVRRLDSVEPQPLTHHPQPASKTPEENAVAKEKAQSGNSVKDRLSGLMGKIKDGVQIGSNAIKILEFFREVASLIGLGVFGVS